MNSVPQSLAGVCAACRWGQICCADAPALAPDALWPDGCSAAAPWLLCSPSPPAGSKVKHTQSSKYECITHVSFGVTQQEIKTQCICLCLHAAHNTAAVCSMLTHGRIKHSTFESLSCSSWIFSCCSAFVCNTEAHRVTVTSV